ncbi:MAG: hypothetical protein A2W25_07030 [candidate division Zixibacteria bacterium RBG_16_53_22]|nr:MAG: hypothetical protein A2W25_07030 [candidate division Zixibacteria bacterium RBG_16_53_22]
MNISVRQSAVLACLFGLSIFRVTLADYHYASHAGSDEYPYTSWETAADSIQEAIDAASPGDTIYMGSGVWSDVPCTLWTGRALIGRGIDSTFIRKAGNVVYLFPRDSTLVEAFTFDTPNGNFDSARAIYIPWRSNRVHDVTIKGNRFLNVRKGMQIVVDGIIDNNLFYGNSTAIDASFDACSLLVKNNTIIRCTETSTISSSGGQWFVVNNIFAHNRGEVSITTGRPGDTAYVANNLFFDNLAGESYYMANLQVVGQPVINNTFVGPGGFNRPSAMGVFAYQDFRLAKSINNTFNDFEVGLYHNLDAEVSISYTNIWHVTYNDAGWGQAHYLEGNLFSDPMFADTNDFHLQMLSPLIDAGDPSILDVDGTRSDIGAYGGPGGESYQYLDLPPQMPDSMANRVWNDTIYLAWRMNYEADFFGYMLHRDVMPGFTPSPANLIAEPESSFYSDGDVIVGETYYYRIASLDSQGNRSEYSPEIAVVVVGIGEGAELPKMTVIESNYPNPFNENTIISYYLADIGYRPAEAKLTICDIGGRLIRTLVNQRQYPGNYKVAWDGRDEGDEAVASGIYFARLIVSGLELSRARKITLLK